MLKLLLWWVVAVMVGALVTAVVKSHLQWHRCRKMERYLKKLNGTQTLMGCDGHTAVAIDEKHRRVHLLHYEGGVKHRTLRYGDILSAEVFQDGSSVTRTVRSSQVGGAIVGGVLLGGVGALIGGLSGKQKTDNKVERVDLRLTVKDTSAPTHDVRILASEVPKGSGAHESAMKQARHWAAVMEVVIKHADERERRAAQQQLAAPASPSLKDVARQLQELTKLQGAGVLTADEFQSMKKRLLEVHA